MNCSTGLAAKSPAREGAGMMPLDKSDLEADARAVERLGLLEGNLSLVDIANHARDGWARSILAVHIAASRARLASLDGFLDRRRAELAEKERP